jgi:rhodanese-related sulfurtransferase
MIKSTSPAELKQWLDSGDAVLVDVREDSEWAAGHIAGATHVKLGTVSLDKMPSFEGKKLVMQCKMGGRSHTACGMLLQEKPDLDVYNLEGGIMGWVQEGFDISH